MKLPEDKKQRTQVLALIGIGAVVVVVLIFQMPMVGILPIIKAKKEKRAKIEQLIIDIGKANKEVEQEKKDKVEDINTLKKIRDNAANYVIVPELGNYEIPAANYIDAIAQKLDLKLEAKRQLGLSADNGQTFFRIFSLRVTLECSYEEAVKFVKEVENGNPLISVVNIAITGQSPPKQEKHMVSFDVQWPAWTDPEMPAKMDIQIKELSNKTGVSPK